jgi:L-iditol 2-dehydrogenase
MKISVWHNNKDIRLKEIPRPEPGPGEMLVKVHSCGICGSDIVEWYRLPRAPLVQGHEIGGEVVQTGESVDRFSKGDRVFIAPKVPCKKCRYCENGNYPVCSEIGERLPGGFAQYILVPESLIENGTYLLSENISYDQSTFIEPLACVVRAQRLAQVQENQTVMIMGSGMSGLLHVKLAKKKNCRVIAVDINEKKLKVARQFGADMTMAPEDFTHQMAAGNMEKADVVMLCTSALPAIEQAWKMVDKGGAVIFFAVPDPDKEVVVPVNDLWTSEIRILTSYYCGPPDIVESMELLASGAIEVDDMITHRLPLKDTDKGFALVDDGVESIKVIIRPNE